MRADRWELLPMARFVSPRAARRAMVSCWGESRRAAVSCAGAVSVPPAARSSDAARSARDVAPSARKRVSAVPSGSGLHHAASAPQPGPVTQLGHGVQQGPPSGVAVEGPPWWRASASSSGASAASAYARVLRRKGARPDRVVCATCSTTALTSSVSPRGQGGFDEEGQAPELLEGVRGQQFGERRAQLCVGSRRSVRCRRRSGRG